MTREWSGPTAIALRRIYGAGFDPAARFKCEAELLYWRVKPSGPPFDPRQYTAALGIEVEEREGMALDGMLRREGNRFRILLKRDAKPYRKNFTIAHEIGHTFFYNDVAKDASYRGGDCFDPEEERFCDLAAAELLMPSAHFPNDLSRLKETGQVTPTSILGLMNLYKVSLRTVAIQAAEVARDVAVARWRRQGKAIDLVWITPSWLRRLTLCQTGKSSIERGFGLSQDFADARDVFYLEDQLLRKKTSSLRLRSSGDVLSVIFLGARRQRD